MPPWVDDKSQNLLIAINNKITTHLLRLFPSGYQLRRAQVVKIACYRLQQASQPFEIKLSQ